MKGLKTFLLLTFLCALGGCAKQPPVPETQATGSPQTAEVKRVTSVGVVSAAPQPVEVKAGGTAQLIVPLKIQSGYHVNANPPTFAYLKATQLEIAPSEGISAAAISYPSPATRKFAFAEKPLAVYEGETEIKATIKADNGASKGAHSLVAHLRVQACDDQVCYPPGQIELQIPVTVK
ncbi:MAG: protein-disulfide reductase DsbD domain-containing protein [bacterium]